MTSTLVRYIRRLGIRKGIEVYYSAKYGRGERTFAIPGLQSPIVLRAGTSDRPTFSKIFIDQEYAIDLNITPRLIIDGGANVGYAAIFFAHRYPHASIVAVEPEPQNFRLLERNTAAYSNVHRLNKGLWPRDTYLAIENLAAAPDAFRVRETDQPANAIAATTIDTILREAGTDRIDVLKLDVEGAEKELFSDPGSEHWLRRTDVLIIELHDRFKPGCSHAFEQAVSKHPFRRIQVGENLMLMREKTGH
ncbi:MAG TPA: FkbM family methyltransferase [Nitrospiraceae bacterium]|nr:FkbM family methyltransferase [Nitrospiraceae bacterium]